MTDKRKAPRLSPLALRAEFDFGGNAQNAFLTNLSEGGAFLATEAALEPGDEIELQITFPWHLGRLTQFAEVVWLTGDDADANDLPKGVGLSFSDLTGAAREKIRLYMQKFYQLVAQIEAVGLEQALSDIAAEAPSSSPNPD